MSIKTVKEFFEKVAVDKSIQEKIKEVDKIRDDAFSDAVKEIVKIAKSEGFDFSIQDFIEARKEAYAIEAELGETKPEGQKGRAGCYVAWSCGYGILWSKPPQKHVARVLPIYLMRPQTLKNKSFLL